LELKTSVVTKVDQSSRIPASAIAPSRQNQLSISCWPASTICLPVTCRQVS